MTFAAIVGPSGVGKDSVMMALADSPDVTLARRVITRPAAAGGEDFDGVSLDDFLVRRDKGDFLLSWQAHGLHYGVPLTVLDDVAAGQTVLVNLSRAVLKTAQDRLPNLQIISLTAPIEILAVRLANRGRETADDVARRLARGALDLPAGLINVHEVDNSGALEDTVARVRACLQPESA